MTVLVLSLRGLAAILALTTLVGGVPRVAQVALAVTLGLWSGLLVAGSPAAATTLAALTTSSTPLWAVALQELAIGAALGILAALPLLAAAMAGRLVDLAATGRGQGSGGTYSVLFGVLSAAVFVGVDGHVAVLRTLVESHAAMPAVSSAQTSVLSVLAHLAPAAIRLAIPWLVTAAVVHVSVGVGTRVAGRAGAVASGVGAVAVPAALVMMTASLVATLAVALAVLVRATV
jgi:type III secretory pathway component EscT